MLEVKIVYNHLKFYKNIYICNRTISTLTLLFNKNYYYLIIKTEQRIYFYSRVFDFMKSALNLLKITFNIFFHFIHTQYTKFCHYFFCKTVRSFSRNLLPIFEAPWLFKPRDHLTRHIYLCIY